MMGLLTGLRALPATVRGILLMVVAFAVFAATDSMAKFLVRDLTVAMVVWAYFTCQLVLLALVQGRRLGQVARTRRPLLQLCRPLFLIGSTILLFLSLRFMPIADVSALMFLMPILVAALSGPLLGERVAAHLWLAVLGGLVGAMIIIRPGTGMFQAAGLLALAAAGCLSLLSAFTRLLSRWDAPLTTLFYTALVGTVTSSVAVPFFWIEPDALGWTILLAQGVLVGGAHLMVIWSYTLAPAAVVAPYAYSHLIWATVIGFVWFGDLPDAWTIAGALVIVASGVYLLRSESGRGPRVALRPQGRFGRDEGAG